MTSEPPSANNTSDPDVEGLINFYEPSRRKLTGTARYKLLSGGGGGRGGGATGPGSPTGPGYGFSFGQTPWTQLSVGSSETHKCVKQKGLHLRNDNSHKMKVRRSGEWSNRHY
ncbi:unnamed protein product [Haemonchus placei]|uniref:Uncharacterized protein n=1 Tax=Haemonchus placei TaxID=6290 RepID=A0A0N4XBZ3_HAEPC|nr:unnamed protein product [Haemonchus placei]